MRLRRWYALVDDDGEIVHKQQFIQRDEIRAEYHPDNLQEGWHCGICADLEGALRSARSKILR